MTPQQEHPPAFRRVRCGAKGPKPHSVCGRYRGHEGAHREMGDVFGVDDWIDAAVSPEAREGQGSNVDPLLPDGESQRLTEQLRADLQQRTEERDEAQRKFKVAETLWLECCGDRRTDERDKEEAEAALRDLRSQLEHVVKGLVLDVQLLLEADTPQPTHRRADVAIIIEHHIDALSALLGSGALKKEKAQ